MSKITNDGLTRSGTGCFGLLLYPYDNSGRQRVKVGWGYKRRRCLSVCPSVCLLPIAHV